MRKILFRGKRMDNGEWVIGDGIHYPKSVNYKGTCWIDGMGEKANDWVRVIPETVGQYTGQTDFDGKPIFEGDLFDPCDSDIHKCVVEFRESAFRVVSYGILGAMMEYGWDETAGGYGELDEHDLLDWIDSGVIGNIYDNPELIGGTE